MTARAAAAWCCQGSVHSRAACLCSERGGEWVRRGCLSDSGRCPLAASSECPACGHQSSCGADEHHGGGCSTRTCSEDSAHSERPSLRAVAGTPATCVPAGTSAVPVPRLRQVHTTHHTAAIRLAPRVGAVRAARHTHCHATHTATQPPACAYHGRHYRQPRRACDSQQLDDTRNAQQPQVIVFSLVSRSVVSTRLPSGH